MSVRSKRYWLYWIIMTPIVYAASLLILLVANQRFQLTNLIGISANVDYSTLLVYVVVAAGATILANLVSFLLFFRGHRNVL